MGWQSYRSLYNTPILPVKKLNGKYHMFQDVRAIDETGVLLQPIVPNSYTLWIQVSHNAKFSVLDLKDALLHSPSLLRVSHYLILNEQILILMKLPGILGPSSHRNFATALNSFDRLWGKTSSKRNSPKRSYFNM